MLFFLSGLSQILHRLLLACSSLWKDVIWSRPACCGLYHCLPGGNMSLCFQVIYFNIWYIFCLLSFQIICPESHNDFCRHNKDLLVIYIAYSVVIYQKPKLRWFLELYNEPTIYLALAGCGVIVAVDLCRYLGKAYLQMWLVTCCFTSPET